MRNAAYLVGLGLAAVAAAGISAAAVAPAAALTRAAEPCSVSGFTTLEALGSIDEVRVALPAATHGNADTLVVRVGSFERIIYLNSSVEKSVRFQPPLTGPEFQLEKQAPTSCETIVELRHHGRLVARLRV